MDVELSLSSLSRFHLTSANAISNTGFVTAYGTDASGQTEAFLLTPDAALVPEASSALSLGLLLAIGLGGTVISARRRKSAV